MVKRQKIEMEKINTERGFKILEKDKESKVERRLQMGRKAVVEKY